MAIPSAPAVSAEILFGFHWTGFIDDDFSAAHFRVVELGDSGFGGGVVLHLDESETARAARHFIEDKGGAGHLPVIGKQRMKLILCRGEGKVPYE